MSTPRKKYFHLPLIADELKEDAKRRDGLNAMDSGQPAQSGKRGKKEGECSGSGNPEQRVYNKNSFGRALFFSHQVTLGSRKVPDDITEDRHVERFFRDMFPTPPHLLPEERPVIEVGKLHRPLGMWHHAEHPAVSPR